MSKFKRKSNSKLSRLLRSKKLDIDNVSLNSRITNYSDVSKYSDKISEKSKKEKKRSKKKEKIKSEIPFLIPISKEEYNADLDFMNPTPDKSDLVKEIIIKPKESIQKTEKSKIYSEEEILEHLKDTKEVEDISEIHLNDKICYFTTDQEGNKVFRKGGTVQKIIKPFNRSIKIKIKNDSGFEWDATWDKMSSCHKLIRGENLIEENKKIREELKKIKRNNKELMSQIENLTQIIDSHSKTLSLILSKI